MLDFDEVMEPDTCVPVEAALRELEKHGHKTYIEGNDIYSEIEYVGDDETVIVEDSFVARIYDGEVYTLEVMQWLGY